MNMKNIYIQPETDIIVADNTIAILLDSDNTNKTGTGQEGDGESGLYVPGTGSDLDPEEGGRNANSFSLWDE